MGETTVSKKMASNTAKKSRTAIALVHGRTDDGEGLRIIRAKEDGVEVGEVRSVKEGQSIQGELVRLTPRAESPILFDCETLVELPKRAKTDVQCSKSTTLLSQGPAQVATEQYRNNWDSLWGPKKHAIN